MLQLPDLTTPASVEFLTPELQKLCAEVRATGKPGEALLLDLPLPTGGTATALARAESLPSPSGPPEVLLTLRALDVAGPRSERLQHLDRLASLGTLSAGVAHELRNSIVALRTLVDLLLEKKPQPELVELVRKEMLRADAIASRMLNFAAPDLPAPEATALHTSIQQALQLVQPLAGAHSILTELSLLADPDTVYADRIQIEQVFLNLFLNACQAMTLGGKLTVKTELFTDGASTQLKATVQDNGPGLTPEIAAHLFEPFVSSRPEGSGLGLHMTRRIVEQHRGSIAVQTSPGGGTSFELLLPTQKPAAS